MKKKVNLFIPVEIKKRDFASRTLIAFKASLKNFNVYIGRKSEIDQIVFKKNPGIYLGLVTTETYANFYKKLKKYGHYVYVNDEEGLITFSDSMYLDLKVSKKSLEFIDKIFLWSISHKELFEKRFHYEDKYIISGSPRFDLSKNNFIQVFQKESNIIKNKYQDYILVCCSFSFANYYLKNHNYIKTLKKQKVIKNNEDLNNFNKYLHYNKEALDFFLNAIPILAKKFNKSKIIVRPHPSENSDIYINLSQKFKNVFVEEKYSIHAWIINSKCIIHNYCTSSSEALSLSIPRFALRKSFDKTVHKTIPYEISSVCKNIDELIYKINNLLTKNKYEISEKKAKKDFKKYLHNIDDQTFASSIIVESFSNCINNIFFKKNILYYFYLNNLFYLKKYIKLFIYPNYNKNNLSNYINHKVDKITKSEVHDLIKLYLLNKKDTNIDIFNLKDASKNVVNISINKIPK